jgi:hypothetical protein
MKILNVAFAALMIGTYASPSWIPSMVSVASAETAKSEAKVMEIQQALREFGFYKGKIDGKIRRSLYDAMSKYTAYVRSKGWSDSTGELTEKEIGFLLKQYDKRIASLASEKGGSGEASGSKNSSGTVAAEPSTPSGAGAASADNASGSAEPTSGGVASAYGSSVAAPGGSSSSVTSVGASASSGGSSIQSGSGGAAASPSD